MQTDAATLSLVVIISGDLSQLPPLLLYLCSHNCRRAVLSLCHFGGKEESPGNAGRHTSEMEDGRKVIVR